MAMTVNGVPTRRRKAVGLIAGAAATASIAGAALFANRDGDSETVGRRFVGQLSKDAACVARFGGSTQALLKDKGVDCIIFENEQERRRPLDLDSACNERYPESAVGKVVDDNGTAVIECYAPS